MDKKYVLERSRLRGLVMSAMINYGDAIVKKNPDLKIEIPNIDVHNDLDALIDEYATEHDEVE